MPVVELSNHFIKHSLFCPDGKRSIEWCDDPKAGGVPGLYCRVQRTSQGQGTYYLRFKDPDTCKTTHIKIRRTTDVSLAQARKEAIRLRSEIAKGENPQQEKRGKKKIPLLKDFVKDTYLPHVKNRRSYSEYEGLLSQQYPSSHPCCAGEEVHPLTVTVHKQLDQLNHPSIEHNSNDD